MMEQQNDAVLEAAAEHIRHDRLDAAEELLRGRAKEGPGSTLVGKQLATIAFKRGELAQAAALLGDVLAANAKDADGYTLLSAVYMAQRKPDEALRCAERASALDPESPKRTMNLAVAEQAAGHVDRAIGRLEALAKADAGSAEIAYNLGTMYLDARRNQLARRELVRATELNPGRAEGWANLAAAEQGLGNLAAALAAIDRALLLDPLGPFLLTSKAGMLSDTGDLDRAIELAERAMILQPHATTAIFVKALALMRKGDWVQAAGTHAQALRLDPSSALATFALAVVLRRQGKLNESLLALERAEQLGDERGQARQARARLLLQLGRFEEAIELWSRRSPKGTPQVSSLDGIDRLLVLLDPDVCITIALLRYVPLLAARGIEVVLAVPGGGEELARSVDGVAQTLAPADPVPEGIAIVSLRRLPRLLSAEAAPLWPGPYLRASRGPASASRVRIGVCTEAPLEDWCPRSWCPRGWAEPAWSEVVEALGSLGELIRLRAGASLEQIAGLDLVVAADGRVAHLAGAMGRPLIVLLDASGGWAWPAGSRWYPDAHVVRETARADFTLPLGRLEGLVSQVLAARPGGG